jgi:hypothetical protein
MKTPGAANRAPACFRHDALQSLPNQLLLSNQIYLITLVG